MARDVSAALTEIGSYGFRILGKPARMSEASTAGLERQRRGQQLAGDVRVTVALDGAPRPGGPRT